MFSFRTAEQEGSVNWCFEESWWGRRDSPSIPLLQPRRRVLLTWELCALDEGKEEGASAGPGCVLAVL